MEIKTFARVQVNLKLSVNEKFVAYGAMVKIIASVKGSFTKGCYFMEKPEPMF